MVISETPILPEVLAETPEVEVIPSTQFYWYVTPEDFDEENNLTISITSGRLRHRWVPTTKQAAKIYLREHDDAIGILTRGPELLLVKIYSHDVEDVTEKYPTKLIEGLTGMVIKSPIEIIIPKGRGMDKNDEAMTPFYTVGEQDRIRTTPSQEIDSIQIGIMSEEDIDDLAVMEVLMPDAFLDDALDTPVVNGIHDLRMGSLGKGVEQNYTCQTCNKQLLLKDALNSCQGHFGYVELEEYIPKLLYLGVRKRKARPTYPLLNTLNHVCHSCNHILLPDNLLLPIIPKIEQQFGLGKRNFEAYNNIRTILNAPFKKYWKDGRLPCPHCDEFSPEVNFQHSPKAEFYIPIPDERYRQDFHEPGRPFRELDFETVRLILADIPLDQCRILGFDTDHALPQDMFWKKFPIGPNTMRPKVEIPGKDNLDLDDLTKLYQDVIIANNQLRTVKQRGYGPSSVIKNTTRLYTAVSRITDNQVAAIGSGGTKTEYSYQGGQKAASFEGILNRFHGKEGRFRSNLQAKHVEEVGYSTVAPNGDLAIDEVGVPIEMCMEIGIEETVTKDNFDRLHATVLNGRNKYPGALFICLDGNTSNQGDGNWKILPSIEEDEYDGLTNAANGLNYGSIVKRHVIKGDIGLFNRAPSLHRQSVMAFRSIPLEQKCLTFNATVCDPFNADYDGDAMKFHFPQTKEAIDEAKKYMQLTNNLIHARYGKLAVANDQDQVSGIYLLTHTNKRRKGEWNRSTGVGFTDEGIPYVSKQLAASGFSTVFSLNRKTGVKRTIDSLPEPDTKDGDGKPAYTGRALFSHLFTVLDCEYVSAKFKGNTPQVNDEGDIDRIDGIIQKELVIFEKGKLIQGTLEKNAFGTGGASIAPSFIYHEGYEKGEAKLVEFIEMATRLGLSGHRMIGFTMDIADVQGGPEAQKVINEQYEEAAEKIRKIEDAWDNHTLNEFAEGQDDEIWADMDPLGFMEEKIYNISQDFEKAILEPIQDDQGSGNPMQISVRSKARGEDTNVQQMGGSYGLVQLSGERITHGITADRVMSHFPSNDNSAKYTGFIKASYSTGMSPTDYWVTSTAGRRSTVESGMGNLALSGYLERKLIKGIESYVVDKQLRVVNLRTNRIVSPIVGGDGLKAYHIRGDDEKYTNGKGHIITLQPFFYDFECKHGEYLAYDCGDCSKGSNITFFLDEIDNLTTKDRIKPSSSSTRVIKDKLTVREVTKPNVRKMAKRYTEFYRDSLCRPGEAIGAVAAACLGEPATQAALRTFHFAGKVSFQGSTNRVKQLLETPEAKGSEVWDPRTILRFHEGTTEEAARNVVDTIRTVLGKRVIKLVTYDLDSMSIVVMLDWEKMKLYRINAKFLLERFKDVIEKYGGEVQSDTLEENNSIVAKINLISTQDGWFLKGLEPKVKENTSRLLLIKEDLMGTTINGFGNVEFDISLKPPENDKEFGRYFLDIRDCSDASLNMYKKFLPNVIDFYCSDTTNIGWIYEEYGLEAALMSIYDQLDSAMNGSPGSKGIGEYDTRYIRTICDIMGEEGRVSKLGISGLGALNNPSMLGGASLERPPPIIMASSMMGQYDPLKGIAESVAVGKTLRIGDYAPNNL